MILVFWRLSFKPAFSLSSFTFIKSLFGSSLLCAIRVVSSAYLRLLIFLPAILIPSCASSSLAFHMIYSAYKLNNQIDNIQPCCAPFSICNQSVVPCPILTVASWPAQRFSPWLRKIPWRRAWQPTPVFLLEKSHGQKRLVCCSRWCHRVRHYWETNHSTCGCEYEYIWAYHTLKMGIKQLPPTFTKLDHKMHTRKILTLTKENWYAILIKP